MKYLKYKIFFFACFIISFQSKAQFEHLTFQNITLTNGLSNNYVNCLAQDTAGYIWIGTNDGLNRYDGYEIKRYYNIPSDSNSLSDNKITALCIDNEGILWIGTEFNSLCRYNTVDDNFIRYKSLPHNNYGVSHHFITDLKTDTQGRLWATTQEGISLYHKKKDKFEQFNFGLQYQITNQSIELIKQKALKEDLIIAIKSIKFKVFNTKYEFISNFKKAVERKLSKIEIQRVMACVNIIIPEDLRKYNHFKTLASDGEGNLWLVYQDLGFAYFDVNKKEIENFSIYPHASDNENSNIIRSIIVDGDYLWLGTFNDGMYLYSIQNKTFRKVFDKNMEGVLSMAKYDNNIMFFSETTLYMESTSMKNNSSKAKIVKSIPEIKYNATSIIKDNANNYWIASEGEGVFMIYQNKQFNIWNNSESSEIKLRNREVSAITADNNDNLYVGYYRNDVEKINIKNKKITTYAYNESDPQSISWGSVLALLIDTKDNLWVGSYYGGLQKKPNSTYKFSHFHYNNIKDYRGVVIDKNNNIFAVAHGNGLLKFDSEGNLIKHLKADYSNWQNSLPDDWVNDICIDKDEKIWIASSQGLCVTDVYLDSFKSYRSNIQDSLSLSHNHVLTLYCDKKNNIWVGTTNGLNLFNRREENFKRYTMVDGLANSSINSITEDNKGNIWLGTNIGLSRLIVKGDKELIISQIENYDIHDGVPGEFYQRVVTRTNDGTLFFGGRNGISWFHPDSIKANKRLPKVVISDIKVFNVSVFNKKSEFSELRDNLIKNNSITLEYSQNVISIDFTALSYVESSKNLYSCMLEGFDAEWQYIGNNHRATYTNLSPGTYTFKVKASNNDGVWSKYATTLEIKILPLFWRSPLGYTISTVLIISLLLIVYIILRSKEKLQNRIKLRRIEAEKLKELDKSKSKFFTNITHEFRTPITLILGPIRKIINTKNEDLDLKKIKPHLQLVNKNAELLLRLVNQILDFKKSDAGKLTYKPKMGNIINFIINIAETFKNMAIDKNIVFNIIKNREQLFMLFSADKLEKIIYNLLSNAFKYTFEFGKIDLRIEFDEQSEKSNDFPELKIIVEDTGIGISKENLENLFSLYYQADNATVTGNPGTGVGLYMVKTYTELHGGKVSVVSTLHKGSVFTATIPVHTNVNSSDEYEASEDNKSKPIESLHVFPVTNKKINILIVEDNADIMFFLKNELEDYFEVRSANDGIEALKGLKTHTPDIILSDIMMPNMDGLELCRKIKDNISLCHIPVILLTAKISRESKILGYKAGADDYITKPFDPEILVMKIQRIMEGRKIIQEKISNSPDKIPNEISTRNNAETKFLEQLFQILEKNIDNSAMDVEFLAKELSIGRTIMYEKINVLTGQSVADFMKTYRLNRAAQIIKSGESIISEVVWKVGFKSHAHFTRAFKQKFNCTPSQYMKNNKK